MLALMGSAMARVLFDLEKPTVGLLNIGVEEVKGVEAVRDAAELLRSYNLPHLDFIGFVEGDGIGAARPTLSSPKDSPATSRSRLPKELPARSHRFSARR